MVLGADMADVTFRQVTPSDLVAVRAALIETWHATYDGIYGPDKVRDITTRWHNVLALAAQIEQSDTAFLLAERDGDVIASSFAGRIEPDVVHLYRLYVRPSAQAHGVGVALMQATFAALPSVSRYRLEVEPRNSAAIAFYQRHGFVQIGTVSDCGAAIGGANSGIAALVLERQGQAKRRLAD
jgi:ribosomal protein S18 acetylase RimI-like enzyme